MADVKTILFEIIAKDNASRTFSKVGTETEKAGGKTHKFGLVAGAALAGAGLAAVGFGKKSVEAYSNAAKESMQLARVTGLTIKQSSQLRFAGEESGVEFAKLSTGMKLFGKNLGATAGDSAKTAAMTKELGFQFKDAHGKLLPMSELLPKVADRFKHMPDGPQKTAMAMKLFGRGGADMIKVLNKGSDGLKELAKESDKTGNTIGNTSSLKKQIMAQREFHAAINGLMITIGSLLMPVITRLSVYMTKNVAPAFTKVGKFVKQNHDWFVPLVKVLGTAVLAIVAVAKVVKIWTAAQLLLDAALVANPIGVVVVLLASLAAAFVYAWTHSEKFRENVVLVFKSVGDAAKFLWTGVIRPYFKFIIDMWFTVAGALVNGAAKAFGWVPGLGPKLRAAAGWFNDFKNKVNNALDGTKDKKKITITTPGASTAISNLATIRKLMHDISSAKPMKAPKKGGIGVLLTPGANARGTSNWRGGPTWVGERGPELVDLPQGSQVHTAAASARMAGGDETISRPFVMQLEGKTIHEGLLVYKRRNGISSLGLA